MDSLFDAFDETCEAHGANKLEVLLSAYAFFKNLEDSLTPEQRADFRTMMRECEEMYPDGAPERWHFS
jgi:hypothetical protein